MGDPSYPSDHLQRKGSVCNVICSNAVAILYRTHFAYTAQGLLLLLQLQLSIEVHFTPVLCSMHLVIFALLLLRNERSRDPARVTHVGGRVYRYVRASTLQKGRLPAKMSSLRLFCASRLARGGSKGTFRNVGHSSFSSICLLSVHP